MLNILFLTMYALTISLIHINASFYQNSYLSLRSHDFSEHSTQAMREKIDALERNSTCEIIDK